MIKGPVLYTYNDFLFKLKPNDKHLEFVLLIR